MDGVEEREVRESAMTDEAGNGGRRGGVEGWSISEYLIEDERDGVERILL